MAVAESVVVQPKWTTTIECQPRKPHYKDNIDMIEVPSGAEHILKSVLHTNVPHDNATQKDSMLAVEPTMPS